MKKDLHAVTEQMFDSLSTWGSDPLNQEMFCLIFTKKDRQWLHLCHLELQNDSPFSALCIIHQSMSEHHRLQFRVHTTEPNDLRK